MKEMNMFHNYETKKITRKASDTAENLQLKGSVKEPNISIYFFFFRPSLNSVLFPMFCLLVEGECQILVFKNNIS